MNFVNRFVATARVALTWAMWGVWGGAAAGLADAVFSTLRLWDQVAGFRRIELLSLGVAIGAGIGVLLSLVAHLISMAVAATTKLLGKQTWSAALWPAMLASPLVLRATFSIFAGPKAQHMPGHRVISTALFFLGIALIGALGAFVVRVVASSRRQRVLFSFATVLLFLLLAWSNTAILPRLYPWFHDSLAVLVLALSLVAARVLLVNQLSGRQTTLSALLLLVPCLIGLRAITTSRQVRFALFDKTAALRVYARFLPLPDPQRSKPPMPTAELGSTTALLPEGPKRPAADVVLITIDAVRPDHVGAYGYARPTTPHLDALAAQSTRFERAYTQAPHTSFATTSMLTGKYYPTLLRLKAGEGGDPITTVLRRYGWRTAAFFPPAVFFVDGDKLASFRDSSFQFEYVKVEFMAAEPRIEQIKEYFETIKPERAFLWVHFFEPHEPYEAHEGFDFGATDKDRYDGEIAYTDRAVGRLVRYLNETRPNAIVIVSADHGEEFDEHQGRYHGSTLYEEQVRVPLLIHIPGNKPRVVGGQVELLDLAPTILALLEIPLPARMKGTDLGPWLSDSGAPELQMPPAFAEVEDKRMIVANGEKLICSRSSTSCQFFDLLTDPLERNDLVDTKPQNVDALHAKMERWLDEQGRLEVLTSPDAVGGMPKCLQQGRLGDMQATAGLVELVTNAPQSAFGQEAAQLLATMPPQPELAQKLSDLANAISEKSAIASNWLLIAAYSAGADVKEEIVALIGMSEQGNGDLPLYAALTLAEQGHGQGLSLLIASLSNCNGTVLCRRSIHALGLLRAEAALPALHQTMSDPNARLDVVQALGQIKSIMSLPLLIEALLSDDRVPVRAAAAAVIAQYPGNAGTLRQAARREREPAVKAAIRAALAPSPKAPPTPN